jgi:hypothetical protein
MKTFDILLKIFYTLLIISLSVSVATYTINLINEKDDLISLAGFTLTSIVCLLGVWVFNQVWGINKQEKKQTK